MNDPNVERCALALERIATSLDLLVALVRVKRKKKSTPAVYPSQRRA